MRYTLVTAQEVLEDDNGGLIYGIEWQDENGYPVDCEWFFTEEQRQLAVDEENNK